MFRNKTPYSYKELWDYVSKCVMIPGDAIVARATLDSNGKLQVDQQVDMDRPPILFSLSKTDLHFDSDEMNQRLRKIVERGCRTELERITARKYFPTQYPELQSEGGVKYEKKLQEIADNPDLFLLETKKRFGFYDTEQSKCRLFVPTDIPKLQIWIQVFLIENNIEQIISSDKNKQLAEVLPGLIPEGAGGGSYLIGNASYLREGIAYTTGGNLEQIHEIGHCVYRYAKSISFMKPDLSIFENLVQVEMADLVKNPELAIARLLELRPSGDASVYKRAVIGMTKGLLKYQEDPKIDFTGEMFAQIFAPCVLEERALMKAMFPESTEHFENVLLPKVIESIQDRHPSRFSSPTAAAGVTTIPPR